MGKYNKVASHCPVLWKLFIGHLFQKNHQPFFPTASLWMDAIYSFIPSFPRNLADGVRYSKEQEGAS